MRKRWAHARWVKYTDEWVLLLDHGKNCLHHEHAYGNVSPELENQSRSGAVIRATVWACNCGYEGLKWLPKEK